MIVLKIESASGPLFFVHHFLTQFTSYWAKLIPNFHWLYTLLHTICCNFGLLSLAWLAVLHIVWVNIINNGKILWCCDDNVAKFDNYCTGAHLQFPNNCNFSGWYLARELWGAGDWQLINTSDKHGYHRSDTRLTDFTSDDLGTFKSWLSSFLECQFQQAANNVENDVLDPSFIE